jgi:hypothetical protein
MTPSTTALRPLRTRPGSLSALRITPLALSALLVLSACGGGGGGATGEASTPAAGGPGSGTAAARPTATAYAAGEITGLGSIIVNGVRYDDSTARVVGDDDSELRDDRRRLKLGMQVEVGSGAVDDSSLRARAESIRVGSELVGTVERITTDAGGQLVSFVLLGQTVLIQRPGTAVDDSLAGGLAGIRAGSLLEVHAVFNGSAYVASFIEGRSAASVTRFKVRGTVTALDTTAQTFRIGGTVFSYAGLAANAIGASLAEGALVRVEVANSAAAAGNLRQVLSIQPGRRTSSGLTSSSAVGDARLRGAVTRAPVGSSFELGGTTVQVDGSTRFDKGSLSSIVAGTVVEVRGVLQGSTLIASRVTLRKAEDRSGGNGGGGSDDDFGGIELHGSASGIDLAANRFTLTHASGTRYTVTYQLDFDAVVSTSPKLEVKGRLGADGRTIEALLIKRED